MGWLRDRLAPVGGRTYSLPSELLQVPPNVESMVGGASAPAKGLKLNGVHVRGTASAVWNVYIGPRSPKTYNTEASDPSGFIPFSGDCSGPWEQIRVTVRHDAATPQDFACTCDLEEVA